MNGKRATRARYPNLPGGIEVINTKFVLTFLKVCQIKTGKNLYKNYSKR